MNFSVDELLAWADQHTSEEWATLSEQVPFHYRVIESGIEYITSSGKPRKIPRNELESFCNEFQESRSFSPGDYPERWHKSYSLPLIQRFLRDRGLIA